MNESRIERYPDSPMVAAAAGQVGKGPPTYNPTIRENLDNRIAEHKKIIEELERIKAAMPENLVDMKIQDLRQAMQF